MRLEGLDMLVFHIKGIPHGALLNLDLELEAIVSHLLSQRPGAAKVLHLPPRGKVHIGVCLLYLGSLGSQVVPILLVETLHWVSLRESGRYHLLRAKMRKGLGAAAVENNVDYPGASSSRWLCRLLWVVASCALQSWAVEPWVQAVPFGAQALPSWALPRPS